MSHRGQIKTPDLGALPTSPSLPQAVVSHLTESRTRAFDMAWTSSSSSSCPVLRPMVPLNAYPLHLTLTQPRVIGHGFLLERGPRM